MTIASIVIGITHNQGTFNVMFTSSDCTEMSYGNQHNAFALCFEGWDVSSCDNHNIDKQLYCASYSPSELSVSRYLSILTPKDSKSFNLDNTCLNASRYALSNNQTSHNPNDAIVFYLLKGSAITIELCSNDNGSDDYVLDIILLDKWLAVESFLDYSASFDRSSIIVNKSIQYGEREGCKNHTIDLEASTFTYLTIEVHEHFASFRSLKGFIHQYYYNATELGIISDRNKVSSDERFIIGNDTSTLICTVPNVNFFQLCEKPSFSFMCGYFISLAIACALVLVLTGCLLMCGNCLIEKIRHRRHHGYSQLI